MKIKLNLIAFLFIFCLYASNSQWKEISQGLEGGQVNYICNGKNNDFFAATLGNDLYYSNDGTNNWVSINDSLKKYYSCYIFSNHDTLISTYLAGNFFNYSFDYGKKWNYAVTSLSSVLLTIYKDNKFYVATSKEFAVSLDSGIHWIQTGPNITGTSFRKALYEKNTFYLLNENGLYKSNDYGSSWNYMPFETSKPYVDNLKIINDVFYFTYGDTLFYSNNQGENWQYKKTNISSIINFELFNNYFYLNTNLNGNFLLSKDLKEINPINDIFKNKQIIYSKKIDSTVFFCTYNGIYASTNDGITWEKRNNGLTYKNGDSFFRDNEKIYLKSGLNLYEFNKTENRWVEFDKDTIRSIFKILTNLDRKFILTYNGLLVKDTNNNLIDYIKFSPSYPNDMICKDNKLFLRTSGSKLLISIDNGKEWVQINEKIDSNIRISRIGFINDDIYFKGTIKSNSFYYVSKDNGLSWIRDTTLDDLFNYSSDYTNIFDRNFYATIDNGFSGFINISTDYGQTWENKLLPKINLSYPSCNSLFGTRNFIFANTHIGVFLSLDKGDNWIEVNEGLKTLNTTSVIEFNGDIYLGTTNGVFTAKLSDFGLSAIEEPKIENDNYLYSFPAYPVPSSNGYIRSMIYWDNNDDIDNAIITITNSIGEMIKTENRITLDKSGPNNGILNWNCSSYPKGAYFIKIQHGSVSSTSKVIVE